MKEIELTKGQVTLVDDDDYEKFGHLKWHALKSRGNRFRAARSVCNKGKKRTLLLHREIIGAEPGDVVDHINRNPLDNRRSNLRIASHTKNLLNRPNQPNNKSGFKGVYWSSRDRLWMVDARAGEARISRGFKTAADAARAYDDWVTVHHGEFACTNEMMGNFDSVKIDEAKFVCKKRTLLSSNTSGYLGVYTASGRKWRVAITSKDGRQYSKSGFMSAREAALWRDVKAVELLGKDTPTNQSMGLL